MEIGKEGEGRAMGRGSTARGGARKPIGGGNQVMRSEDKSR